jgi:hypothetical protein|tara:strand:+ start:10833 stop:11096 length:264 start_codon:yes stop_codon:yes gene_type:complete
MKLSNFNFNPTQILLNFGEKYSLSIINNGHGKAEGLYEIGMFSKGVMTEMPGITIEGDTVRGFLTEDEVDIIIKKLVTVSRHDPVQV